MHEHDRYAVRCFGSDGLNWVQPADMDSFTGVTAKQDAIRRMRELALDMRDTLARRFGEPFVTHELATLPVVEVERVSDGKAHVRYEVVDMGKIIAFRESRRW